MKHILSIIFNKTINITQNFQYVVLKTKSDFERNILKSNAFSKFSFFLCLFLVQLKNKQKKYYEAHITYKFSIKR